MIFRKTALGQEELRSRKAGLSPRERSVLIVVNGELETEAVCARLAMDVRGLLQALADRGFIEGVAAPVPPTPPPPPPPPEPPSPPPEPPRAPARTPAPAPIPVVARPSNRPRPTVSPQDVAAAQRRALQVLGEVYGPEVPEMVADLLAARDPRAFTTALRELEETLVMYQGRRHALELIARISGHA